MQNLNFGLPPGRQSKLTKPAAEAIAIEALNFLATDPALLDRFLTLSGIGLDNLRAAAAEPGFLAALLDHLASDEKLLLAFAAKSAQRPEAIVKAREILSPPAEPS